MGERFLFRAAAIVANWKVDGHSAVRIEIEHGRGPAFTILVPFQRKGLFNKTVVFGPLSAHGADTRYVWS